MVSVLVDRDEAIGSKLLREPRTDCVERLAGADPFARVEDNAVGGRPGQRHLNPTAAVDSMDGGNEDQPHAGRSCDLAPVYVAKQIIGVRGVFGVG